jgi:hypothetical protein
MKLKRIFFILELLCLLEHRAEYKHRKFQYKQFEHQGSLKIGINDFSFNFFLTSMFFCFGFGLVFAGMLSEDRGFESRSSLTSFNV